MLHPPKRIKKVSVCITECPLLTSGLLLIGGRSIQEKGVKLSFCLNETKIGFSVDFVKLLFKESLSKMLASFEKFVNLGFYDDDWCNFGDKNLICELDLE